MSYDIKVDDGSDVFISILDFTKKTMTLLEPKLEAELNVIDSLEFKMPPNHDYYQRPFPLKSTVEVYEDNDLIWFGRVLSTETDYYRQKTVACEGPMGWFKDTAQTYHEYEDASIHTVFRDIIARHNALAPANRQFTVGVINVDDKTDNYVLDYESTYDAIQQKCLEVISDTYIFFRRENGVNYIDWRKDMPYTCNQRVEFGLNLLDMTLTFDGSNIVTGILPLGDTVQANDNAEEGEIIAEDDPRVGKPLTLEHNYETEFVLNDLAATYGKIIEVVSFSGVKTALELREKALEYLHEEIESATSYQCEAMETHLLNPEYDKFKIGQKVTVKSVPHAIEVELPLTKVEIELDTAAKKVSLGTDPKLKLSQFVISGGGRADYPTLSTGGTGSGSSSSGSGSSSSGSSNKNLGVPKNYKQTTRVDNEPVKNSAALITSGAVYEALGDKWIHQIDGTTVDDGTINFITVT